MPRKASNVQPFSVREFFGRFPDDDACLEHLMASRYGLRRVCAHCGKVATFHRLAKRMGFCCAQCGEHVYPQAGTIFQDTRTSLQSWYYAIYLFVTSRHGVSGKELQRQLGVTYKTAWRIGNKIRGLMEQSDIQGLLFGHVEIDESYVGGVRAGKRGRGAAGKTVVVGMKERGGKIATEIVPDVRRETLRGVVHRHVEPGSIISTDELLSYALLADDGFIHGRVKHAAKEWTYYDYKTGATHSTNNIESFWRMFKVSVRSTHIGISAKHMPKYLGEFTFRANHRDYGNLMFDLLVSQL